MTADYKNMFSHAVGIASIQRIIKATETQGSITRPQIVELLQVSGSQASNYIRHMEHWGMLRCSVPAKIYKGAASPAVWIIETGPVNGIEQRTVKTIAARNAGMQRDPLIAALFGPARTLTLENHD